jgi:antitoxin StbD
MKVRLKDITMASLVLSSMTASVSELKRNPMGTVAAGEGAPVAILNRNEPAFYCVPARTYEAMIEALDDAELNAIADARSGEPVIKVTLDDL